MKLTTHQLSLDYLKDVMSDSVDNSTLYEITISEHIEADLYPRSVQALSQGFVFMTRSGVEKHLWVFLPESERSLLDSFIGETVPAAAEDGYVLKQCPLSHQNANAIRDVFSWASPELVGVRNSYGLGDRLGVANPAHLRQIRHTNLKPVLAQQSIREMERTERTPDEVMDTATWAALQEGYTEGFGADADHLKTPEHIDYTIASGFTMFTFDPGDHVVNEADDLELAELEDRVTSLPWDQLDDSKEQCISRYTGNRIEITEDLVLTPDREDTLRALTKYGKVIAHVKKMYRHLTKNYPDHPREIELSVDETESVTQPFEHYLVVSELQRLGVELVSLAPRFVGGFEKGIDYKGDLDEFRQEYMKHLKIAEKLGPYKLSVHSGSDKFSVYKTVGQLDEGYVHIKTAGTSYLEALRAIAKVEPDLFREILDFSRDLYESEKRSYHVSAEVEKVPKGEDCSDEELVELFNDDQVDARQVMHVCFGQVLTDKDENGEYLFRNRILRTLEENEAVHYETLQAHFQRHFDPIS